MMINDDDDNDTYLPLWTNNECIVMAALLCSLDYCVNCVLMLAIVNCHACMLLCVKRFILVSSQTGCIKNYLCSG